MNSPKYEDKQCNVCGRVFHPTHGRQKMCFQCREYFDAGKFMRTSNAVDTVSTEAEIRRRFIEKEENCRIVGEGYAERQIANTLKKVPPIKTEL